jgi:hypothetical protein
MSLDAAYRLKARLPAQYLNGNHPTYWVPDMNDMAAVAVMIGNYASQVDASAAAAAGSLAVMQGLGASAYGIGIDATDLVRAGQLGGMAFMEPNTTLGLFINLQNVTYQIRGDDFGKLLLATSGTLTWTLPLAADVWVGWQCQYRNRSGASLTLNRAGADTFNAAATTIAIATGAAGWIVCTGATTFEVF